MTESLEAISMEPVKEKLVNLTTHLPRQDNVFYEFVRYFASTIKSPKLNAHGFGFKYELALLDLMKGGDYGKYGRVTIPAEFSHLIGYPSSFYALLGISLPEIARAVCPPEFAEEVIRVHEEINRKMKEDSA